MTYCGPSTQPLNYTHMFNFHNPFAKDVLVETIVPDTVWGQIALDPDATIFGNFVKLAKLQCLLSSPLNKYTLFVPSDSFLRATYNESVFTSVDCEAAMRIVRAATLKYELPPDLLKRSPISQYWTLDLNELFIAYNPITNYYNVGDATLLNLNNALVTSNGIIYKTNNFIGPISY